jgi:2-hydroxychromene-2-carboxylate isomerase
MKVTAIFDILSHWCLAAWPAYEAAREHAPATLLLAPILNGFPMGVPPEHEQWFYRRGSLAYNMTLKPDWYEDDRTTTLYANAAVVAAAELGADLEQTAIATMRAAMQDGVKLGRRDVAIETVAQIVSVDPQTLDRLVDSAAVGHHLNFANAELQRIGCAERPSWFIENANGDHVAMQGVWQKDAVLATIAALRADEDAYVKAGTPPG